MSLLSKKQKSIEADPRQFDEVRSGIFDKFTKVVVEKNRAFLINIIQAISILVLISCIRYMLPLEKTVPYSITETANGEIKADFSAFKSYNPDDVLIEKQSRILVKNLYTILSYKDAVENLDEARSLFVSKANNQFSLWFQQNQPTLKVKKNPDFTRTVEIKSSSMLPNNVVIVRFKTTESNEEEDPIIQNYIITAKYLISPRKSRQEALENPTGIFYEHFTIDEEK